MMRRIPSPTRMLAAALLAGAAASAGAQTFPSYECGAVDARGRAVFPGPGALAVTLRFDGTDMAEDAAEVLAARLTARGLDARVLPASDAPALLVLVDDAGAAALPSILAPGVLGFHLVREDGGGVEVVDGDGHPLRIEPEPFLTGAAVAEASADSDAYGHPAVSVRLDGPGARVFGAVTADHVGWRIAVILDGEVLTVPLVREPILGGGLVLTGDFGAEEAPALAEMLVAGVLPADMAIADERAACPGEGR